MRTATVERTTRETSIRATVHLDGTGASSIRTGLGFLDHMLEALSLHAQIDIDLRCDGDLQVDDHHTVEDCALTLGRAISESLGDRAGIRRFGHAYAPLDEALVRCVIDLSGRACAEVHVPFSRDSIGDVATENIVHFFQSLAMSMEGAVHVDLIRGTNDHHKAEAAFKSLALALREAVSASDGPIASTKGTLR